jgi:hypothetical protein
MISVRRTGGDGRRAIGLTGMAQLGIIGGIGLQTTSSEFAGDGH